MQAIHPFAFNRLDRLEYLETNNNLNLDNLDHQLFTSLINLRSLSLKNSSLTTLDPRLANLFKKLTQIQVSSRKFNCNCSVQWLNLLLNKLRTNQTPKLNANNHSSTETASDSVSPTNPTDDEDVSYVTCSSPDSVIGVNLIDLTTEQLGCYEVKSLIPVAIALVVGLFILIIVVVICVINCRSSHSICMKQRNKHDEDLKYNTDHLASLHSFSNAPSLISNTNNYAFKLGLYDGINRTTTAKSSGKLRAQNKVFTTSDKPLIGDLSRFDTMYKPPLIGSNNFSDILMPNSKSTLINTNKLIKPNGADDQPMIRSLTNPYQIVSVMPPGYDQDYNFAQQQQLLFQQQQQQHKTTNTLHPAQFLNQQQQNHHFNQPNFYTQRIQHHQANRTAYNQQPQDYTPNDETEDYSDHTYATVLNGNEINEIYIASQDVPIHTINHTINPSHLRRLATSSDCSSCSSEPLSRLSNDKPITEL